MENRVLVTIPMIGICMMQVCAVADATDKEILEVCNKENPSGTSAGWGSVIRKEVKGDMFKTKNSLPGICKNDIKRMHFLVLC